MNLNWSSILEGTSAGIAAALLLGLFAISRDRFRNSILKHRIKRTFRQITVGSGVNGISLVVSNHLSRSFRVRESSIVTPGIHFRLNPTGAAETSFKKRNPKLTKDQKRALKKNGTVQLRGEMQFTPWRTEKTSEGFVEIKPYTSQQFLLPIFLANRINAEIESIQFIIEFDNYAGGIDIIQVDALNSVGFMQKTMDRFMESILDGTLNRQRANFGLEPVHPIQMQNDRPKDLKEDEKIPESDQTATLLLPNGAEIELRDFDIQLGELIAIAQGEFEEAIVTPEGFGVTETFFFVNTSTGTLIDSLLDLRRSLSSLFINDGDVIELRLCQPEPQADGTILNPMQGVTKFVN